MDLRYFIKRFTWEEEDRTRITLGPDTRLNPATNRAQLGSWDSTTYPTDADLYVKSWVANPDAVREWAGFQAEILHKEIDNVQVTSEGFRLSDGTDEYWWNGSSWEVNTTDWNTENEVAVNISDFPTTSRKLQIVVNLATSNELVTPELVEIKVLYKAKLDSELEDILLRSIVRDLRTEVRPITRFPIVQLQTGATIDLNNHSMDGDYNIVDVDSVFDHDSDPNHDTDLLSSYNPSTKVITLTGSVAADTNLWLRLVYQPIVAIRTNRDWYEVEHVPELIIEDFRYVAMAELPREDYVGNKVTGAAKIIPNPLQGTLECVLVGITANLVDHMRLSTAVMRYFNDNPFITSTGLDERYRLWLVREHDQGGSPNEEDLHTWRATFRVAEFRVWAKAAQDGYLVKRFAVTGDASLEVP
jgi:hypothetical protein